MFVRKRMSTDSPSYQVIESYREDGKVKQRLLASLRRDPTVAKAIENAEERLAWCESFLDGTFKRLWNFRQRPPDQVYTATHRVQVHAEAYAISRRLAWLKQLEERSVRSVAPEQKLLTLQKPDHFELEGERVWRDVPIRVEHHEFKDCYEVPGGRKICHKAIKVVVRIGDREMTTKFDKYATVRHSFWTFTDYLQRHCRDVQVTEVGVVSEVSRLATNS